MPCVFQVQPQNSVPLLCMPDKRVGSPCVRSRAKQQLPQWRSVAPSLLKGKCAIDRETL